MRGTLASDAVAHPHGEATFRGSQSARNLSRLLLRVRKEQSGGNGSKTQVSPRPSLRARDCLLDDLRENLEASADVCAQVYAQGAAPALRENAEVAACLGCLEDAEGEPVAGDRQVRHVVARQLQEDATVRSALIGLSGRVEKARTKADAGGNAVRVSNPPPNRL